jgi:hypothetical protein
MNLNSEQQKAVENGEPVVVNVAGMECVLVRKDIYVRLDPDCDTGSWTVEEMNLLADEAEQVISRCESHPLAEFAGMFKQDPFLGDWKKSMAAYRRKVDKDADKP